MKSSQPEYDHGKRKNSDLICQNNWQAVNEMIVIHFSVYGVEVAFFSKSDIPDSFPTMTRGNNPVNNNATTKLMTILAAINAQVFCLLSSDCPSN